LYPVSQALKVTNSVVNLIVNMSLAVSSPSCNVILEDRGSLSSNLPWHAKWMMSVLQVFLLFDIGDLYFCSLI